MYCAPTRRPRAHHGVNPYPGARRQNKTKMFSDHDETSPSIAAVMTIHRSRYQNTEYASTTYENNIRFYTINTNFPAGASVGSSAVVGATNGPNCVRLKICFLAKTPSSVTQVQTVHHHQHLKMILTGCEARQLYHKVCLCICLSLCLFGGKQDHLLISGCGIPAP